EPATRYLDRLSFKHADRAMVLQTAELRWIEAEDYYVRIHSIRGRFLLRIPLFTLEARLDPRTFLRVHRGAIVNMEKVARGREEGGLLLVLDDGAEVPVSRSKRSAVEMAMHARGNVDRRLE